ncbi:hypothetical protein DPEC_G00313700 [Dallia pectoralis]|uniref:Uncharacterized protein n=1 Tax=Dallia pectoralis TaxID=75939 RepID=A0ACC2FBZ9_DALPE|nr:hypothetical protein DPEC_G00313700 [Dallia pectoralis]
MSSIRKRDWTSPDNLYFPGNPHMLHTHEPMVDLMNGRAPNHTYLDAVHYGLFGLDFVNPFMGNFGQMYVDDDSDEDYYYDDEEKYPDKSTYCGFKQNFLGQRLSTLPLTPHPRIRQLTPQEAERNAKELLEEENRLKEKAENKRLKKMRHKEKKRADKEKKKIVDDEVTQPGRYSPPETKNQGQESKTMDMEGIQVTFGSGAEGATCNRQQEVQEALILEETKNGVECGDVDEAEGDGTLDREIEELDMSSCFVSTAACIAQRQLQQKPKIVEEIKIKKKRKKNAIIQQPQVPVTNRLEEVIVREKKTLMQASVEDTVKRSTELALIGNQLAAGGQLEMAIKYFTDAIKHNPTEFKLFGNRSFCYEKLHQYDRALCDADLSLSMNPGWIKGLFRRGKALSGLKRYFEACQTYEEVLKQDSLCSDAARELLSVQIMQLMEMGFSRDESTNALLVHGDLEKAINVLSGIEDRLVSNVPIVVASTEEFWEDVGPWEGVGPKTKHIVQSKPPPKPECRSVNPTTARDRYTSGLYAVYVGRFGSSTTQSMLHDLFRSAGNIHSIKILPLSQCAFVNYTSQKACEKAISTLHGKVLNGVTLAVRYPDKVLQKKLGLSQSPATHPGLNNQPNKSEECYYWRTTGCATPTTCVFRHVPQHKGIDRDKVNK